MSVDMTIPDQDARVRFDRVLRSEWRKFFSLRATWILSLCAVGVMLLFAGGSALAIGWTASQEAGGAEALFGGQLEALAQRLAASGLMIAGLLYAAAVVVNMAGEFGSHSAVSTYSAVPRRWPVYVAKALVVGVAGFVAGAVVQVLCSVLVQAELRGYGLDVQLGVADSTQHALVSGLYAVVLAWMGLGLGALMRNTAGAIVTLSVFVYLISSVLAVIAQLAPTQRWIGWMSDHLPTTAVDALRPAIEIPGAGLSTLTLAPWDLWLTIGFWALVPLLLGLWSNQVRGVR